jgi:2-polyprenyl-6-hydroxyphenyl methylase/3-demethylubiquinone-9 3-methyltransferase
MNLSAADIERFDRMAAAWWDRRGPMRVLHAMNPLRIGWIARRLPPAPLRILDVGCGGGIASEALARLGHDVLGLDAAPAAVAAARAHAPPDGPTYRLGTVEALAAEGARFDAITALEVIEHVPDQAAFLQVLGQMLAPGGRLFVSTLNRTPASYAVAILGAEYVARLLPVGTHDWRRFPSPGELAAALRAAGLRPADMAGMAPDPLRGGWRETRSLAINYIAMAAA